MSPIAGHNAFLHYASRRMIRYTTSRRFMRWVARYLTLHLNPAHVSIALLDRDFLSFSIRVSEGFHKIPPHLISLSTDSPLIKWFLAGDMPGGTGRRSRRVVLTEELEQSRDPEALPILREFRLHKIGVCVKIETSSRLTGYLLVGPRQTLEPYTAEDLSLFQILANDIAVEIEKEEYFYFSNTDPLTGLLNRTALARKLTHLYVKCEHSGEEFGAAMIDIDHFKFINDTYGHLAGDHALKAAASLLKANLREGDLIFRYGGEEFLILLSAESRDPSRKLEPAEFRDNAEGVVLRLVEKFRERPLLIFGHSIPVTVSAGLSFLNRDTRKGDSFIAQADEALYYAKSRGRDRVIVYGKITAEPDSLAG